MTLPKSLAETVYVSPQPYEDAMLTWLPHKRFLQSPQGHVDMGAPRTYTDGSAVAHIRKSLTAGKECQASLINYRKGGQPFINLVTIIPIKWEADDDEPCFYVGFQVDLVDQPNAILQTMRDGTHVVNYSMHGGNPDIDRSRFGSVGPGLSGFGLGGDRSKGPLSAELREILASVRNKRSHSGLDDKGTPGWNAAASSVTGAPAVRFIPGDRQERHDFNMMLLENSDGRTGCVPIVTSRLMPLTPHQISCTFSH